MTRVPGQGTDSTMRTEEHLHPREVFSKFPRMRADFAPAPEVQNRRPIGRRRRLPGGDRQPCPFCPTGWAPPPCGQTVWRAQLGLCQRRSTQRGKGFCNIVLFNEAVSKLYSAWRDNSCFVRGESCARQNMRTTHAVHDFQRTTCREACRARLASHKLPPTASHFRLAAHDLPCARLDLGARSIASLVGGVTVLTRS